MSKAKRNTFKRKSYVEWLKGNDENIKAIQRHNEIIQNKKNVDSLKKKR